MLVLSCFLLFSVSFLSSCLICRVRITRARTIFKCSVFGALSLDRAGIVGGEHPLSNPSNLELPEPEQLEQFCFFAFMNAFKLQPEPEFEFELELEGGSCKLIHWPWSNSNPHLTSRRVCVFPHFVEFIGFELELPEPGQSELFPSPPPPVPGGLTSKGGASCKARRGLHEVVYRCRVMLCHATRSHIVMSLCACYACCYHVVILYWLLIVIMSSGQALGLLDKFVSHKFSPSFTDV